MRIRFPAPFLRHIGPLVREAERKKIALYAVGGCVRDSLLGVATKDLDLVAESDPSPILRYCVRRWGGRMEPFGQFGTARFLAASGLRIDFVRARAETYAAPAALPRVRPGSLSEDLARRDFTVNAMAAALRPDGLGELIDPQGGQEDLRRRFVRVLHAASFRDDPTRLLRAARYACRYGLRLEPRTEKLRRAAASEGYADLLSRERLRNELIRILEEKDPGCALRRLRTWSLSRSYHPRFAWPNNVAEGCGAPERLGLIALHMQARSENADSGEDVGWELIRSLHLERPVSQAILEALDARRRRASPRSPLPPLSRRILRLEDDSLGATALGPLLLTGKDLQEVGLASGPQFRGILDRAAQAQWRGDFANRRDALRWLRGHI